MKILLIAGHGAEDPGAIAVMNGKTYREAELARQVTNHLIPKLSSYAQVDLYPVSRNAYYDFQNGSLRDRAAFDAYNYVLEIHFNAYLPDCGDKRVKGTEAWVTTSEAGITVEEAILSKLNRLGYTNRGVKRKNWAVISTAKKCGTSSCLLEVCFIDDADDLSLYLAKQEETAAAIAEGVIEGFGLQTTDRPNQIQAALKTLQKAGIISSPEYWEKHAKTLPYLDTLLLNMADHIV